MAQIIIEKPAKERLEELKINNWGTWECEVSKFDWSYSDQEMCYFFEGEVTVETADGNVNIGVGDLVTFPKGLKCKWNVKKPVRKVYKFG